MADGETGMIGRTMSAALVLLSLAGCATSISWRRREGLDYFVGRPQPALLAAIGAPTREWQTAGMSYLAYEYSGGRWYSGEPGVRTPDTEVPYGPWVATDHCTTVFRVQSGTVTGWQVKGDGCRGAPYPPIREFAASRLSGVSDAPVQGVTQFPDDAYTGRSTVDADRFYSR